MGRAIVTSAAIIVLAIIIAAVVVILRRIQHRETAASKGWSLKGDLNKRQEQHITNALDQASNLFHELMRPAGPDVPFSDLTVLSTSHQAQIRAWITTYHNVKKGTFTS